MVVYRVNVEEIAILFANMLESALKSDSGQFLAEEAHHDTEDSDDSLGKIGIHLHPAVDYGAGAAPSGEHGTAVCSERQSASARVALEQDSDSRW